MSVNRWRYGDSWERYPITEGEVWSHRPSDSRIAVADIREPLPDFMREADMVYTDPPWSKGNVNSFVTKAGFDTYVTSFDEFMDSLFARIQEIGPRACYLEIGKQHRQDFTDRLQVLFPVVQEWPIVYYRKHPCFLLRGGEQEVPADLAGLDDEETPGAAIAAERPECVADLCTGRGLTLLAAHARGARFVGTELNRRRLAVAIERAAKVGVAYAKDLVQ